MADITMLILADHEWFREQFALLDDLQAHSPDDRAALKRVWRPLADKLDVHAYIEEKIFYPQLLKRGGEDAEGETLDAIGDHNDIRDGVREANAATLGSEQWWAAGEPGWPTTITWVKRNEKGCRIFGATPPSDFATHSGASTASSWPSTPPPRGCRSRIATPVVTSSSSRSHPRPNPPTSRCASGASKASEAPRDGQDVTRITDSAPALPSHRRNRRL
jgi:hypothetical protein